MSQKRKITSCDLCGNYSYNDETGFFECAISLDQDEMAQFLSGSYPSCPYFTLEDEYGTVRKQN